VTVDREGVIRFSSVTNLTYNVCHTVDYRKENCKIVNRSKVRAPTKTEDGRTDGQNRHSHKGVPLLNNCIKLSRMYGVSSTQLKMRS
jgi:hypothetical protein